MLKIKFTIAALTALLLTLTACTVSVTPNAPNDTDKPPTITDIPTATVNPAVKSGDTLPSETPSAAHAVNTPEPTAPAVLWIDEKDPANLNAVFHIGMSLADMESAIEKHGLEVKNVWGEGDYKGYDAGPFSLFADSGGLYIIQLGFFDESGIRSAQGFDANSTIADVETALGRPQAACAQDDSIIYLYEYSVYRSGEYCCEIYMSIKKPFKIETISLTSAANGQGRIASPEFDEYDAIHGYVTGKTETIESPDTGEGPELLYFADADGVSRGHYNGIVQKDSFYHDGREIWIGYYYIAVGPRQYAELAGLPYVQRYDEPQEVQLYSNTIDMEQYIGKHIVFNYGLSFEGDTVYHRRDYVVEVTEIIKTVE